MCRLVPETTVIYWLHSKPHNIGVIRNALLSYVMLIKNAHALYYVRSEFYLASNAPGVVVCVSCILLPNTACSTIGIGPPRWNELRITFSLWETLFYITPSSGISHTSLHGVA